MCNPLGAREAGKCDSVTSNFRSASSFATLSKMKFGCAAVSGLAILLRIIGLSVFMKESFSLMVQRIILELVKNFRRFIKFGVNPTLF